MGGVMPETENLQDYAKYCFEVGRLENMLEEDIASEVFELLTANAYDSILAHALGVSL
jgi:hypothetical protein